MTTSSPPPPTFGQWLDQQAGQAGDLGKLALVWKNATGTRSRVSSVTGVTNWLISRAADDDVDPVWVRGILQGASEAYRAFRSAGPAGPTEAGQIALDRGWVQPELPADPPPEVIDAASGALAAGRLAAIEDALGLIFQRLELMFQRLGDVNGKLDAVLGWQGEQDERLEPLRRLMAELGESEDAADAIDGRGGSAAEDGAISEVFSGPLPGSATGLWGAFRMPEPDHGALAERAADEPG